MPDERRLSPMAEVSTESSNCLTAFALIDERKLAAFTPLPESPRMPATASLKLVTLSALIDDAETVESIRNHGEVPPYVLALVPEAEVLHALTSPLREGLIEAFLTDRMGAAVMPVTSPQYDDATFRTYWFLPTQSGWRRLWRNHDAVTGPPTAQPNQDPVR